MTDVDELLGAARHADTVALLLARGADPMLTDTRFDATAADWAEANGHNTVAKLIRAHD